MRTALPSARNILKSWAVLLSIAGALGALGFAAGGYRLASSVAFCTLLAGAAVYWYVDRIVLGMLGAREFLAAEAPALHATLERLARRAGVTKPRLYLLPDGHPRALATGRGPRGSAIAVSRGLLAATAPAELEGVLAHEVAHIRVRDVFVQSAAVLIAAAVLETTRIGGWLSRALLFVFGPLAAGVVHLLLSSKREFTADRLAATLCDSPHGLADALLRLDRTSELVEFTASPATEPLYTINPFAEEGLAAMFATHPPVGERVRRLRALDPDWREKLRAA